MALNTSPLADVLVWTETHRPELLPLTRKENLIAAREAFAKAMAGVGTEKKPRKTAEAQEYATLVLFSDGTYSFCGTGQAARGLGDSAKKLNEDLGEARIATVRRENPEISGVVVSLPISSVAGFPFPSAE